VSLRLRTALPWIALLALAVRVAYVLLNQHTPVVGDALMYHLQGAELADGRGLHRVYEPSMPTAEYPPMHIFLVAFADLLGLHSTEAQKLFFSVIGTGTVMLVALLARAVTRSDRVGVIAGVMAALYPMLWMPDGALMGETTYGFFLVAALLAAVRFVRLRSPGRAAVLGGLIGLAALSRGEALGLLVVLVLPLAWTGGRGSWRRRLVLAAAAVGAFALVLAPWEARLLTTFDKPVLISNNSSGIWVGSNCPETYYGSLIGSWRFSCYGTVSPPGDESVRFLEYRHRGLVYLRDHTSRLPVVVAARVGRLLDVYRPWVQGAYINQGEGRHLRATHLGLIAYWLLIPFAIVGALLLRRRREPALLVLLAPVLLVLLVAIATYGSTRFRFAAEPGLVVLGAVTVDALLSTVPAWLRARRRPASANATSVNAGMSQSQSIEVWKA
jgi:4-amino-4-deoxy-L-arabinose transferase-like glycosyltransferase